MKKKIVLIQDNEDILNLMDDVLQEEGFKVTASLTTEPIEQIKKIEPDLLVVDDNLPGTRKGSEVISDLKSDPDTEEVSSVLTSTASNLADISKACKADDFIEKPFDLDHMIHIVKKNC